MKYEIQCIICKKNQEDQELRCNNCDNLFAVFFEDYFDKKEILNERSMWRYAKMFPWIKNNNIVTLGEGGTPLIKDGNNISFKLEYVSPTGSFKDRGTAMMFSSIIQDLKNKKIKRITEDSSGNAGASISAYSAYLKLECNIYAPETVSGAKAKQIEVIGSNLIKVKGSRDKLMKAAEDAASGDTFYASHIFNPFFAEGTRTLAYEISDQLNWNVPDYIFLPCSAGTMLLGVIKGFRQMFNSNIIPKMPTIIATQTEQVSPLYHEFHGKKYTPLKSITSVADALTSVNPPRLKEMENLIKINKGNVEIASEKEIIENYKILSKKGFHCEPSSAVAYSGFKKWVNANKINSDDKVVIVLSGSGLKSTLP